MASETKKHSLTKNNAITVGQLIEALSKFPPDQFVQMDNEEQTWNFITCVYRLGDMVWLAEDPKYVDIANEMAEKEGWDDRCDTIISFNHNIIEVKHPVS